MATCNKTAVTLNQGRDQQKIPCDNESVIRAPGAAVAHWAHTHKKKRNLVSSQNLRSIRNYR